jgi:hypothetical protein
LKYFNIQAWLLRADGTALAQASPPGHVGVGNAGESTDIVAFTFNRAPATEIAGVVVSVNGSLYIRKISNPLPEVVNYRRIP